MKNRILIVGGVAVALLVLGLLWVVRSNGSGRGPATTSAERPTTPDLTPPSPVQPSAPPEAQPPQAPPPAA